MLEINPLFKTSDEKILAGEPGEQTVAYQTMPKMCRQKTQGSPELLGTKTMVQAQPAIR